MNEFANGFMSVFVGKLGVTLWLILIAVGVVASGELFLVLREIAFNTRKALPEGEIDTRNKYPALEMISQFNHGIAFLIILWAVVSFFLS